MYVYFCMFVCVCVGVYVREGVCICVWVFLSYVQRKEHNVLYIDMMLRFIRINYYYYYGLYLLETDIPLN